MSSIRYFSHITEAVFAFLLNDRIWTCSILIKSQTIYHWSTLNLPRWAASVASYSFGIQNTTHHIPFASRATQWCFTIGVRYYYNPLTIYIAYELLGATLRTNTLPFLILVDKLVLLGSQHHLLLFMHPGSLAGQSIHILSLTLALHIHPPVLSVNAVSPQWAGLFTWTITGASM